MDSLQEFDEPIFKYKQTGILKKNIIGISDAIFVFMMANLVSYLLFAEKYLDRFFSLVNVGIYFFTILILYRLATILLMSSTIAMRLLGTQYMKEGNLQLTVKEKLFAAFMIYIDGIRIYNLK